MDINVSPVFWKNANSVADVVVNQGGTRSGKTYSLLQNLIYRYALGIQLGAPVMDRKRKIDVVRKTRAENKDGPYEDFLKILESHNLYRPSFHNKTELSYNIGKATFQFIGMDQARKKKGMSRDICYINEADGLTQEDYVELSIRTSERMFIDFNPSEEFWFHTDIQDSPDFMKIDSKKYNPEDNPPAMNSHGEVRPKQTYEFIKSTYLDNYDFLPAAQIRTIENLINVDDYYYKVYVLGELAALKGKVYPEFEIIEPIEFESVFGETFYGVDFGFHDPTVLIHGKYIDGKLYERQRYYESGKDDNDFVEFLLKERDAGRLNPNDPIYCDHLPASIRKMRNAGFDARRAKKDDKKDGIRFCQQLKRFVTSDSPKHIKELRQYKYKQLSDGTIVEEPVKHNDHCPDASRYGAYSHLRRIVDMLY